MAPQPLAAGDQITGCGPLLSGSGQPSTISCAAAPLDLRAGRTNTHAIADLGARMSLNVLASSVSTVDLLRADRHVDRDAVARVAGDARSRSLLRLVAAARGAGEGDDEHRSGCRQRYPRRSSHVVVSHCCRRAMNVLGVCCAWSVAGASHPWASRASLSCADNESFGSPITA